MEQVENLCTLLYPTNCCHDILIDYKLESECVNSVVTKTLGYGIIFGSTLVKLPQILKLSSARSGAGLSLMAVFLELIALTFSSSYSLANKFPISAWGESLFLMLMTAVIAFMIIYYDLKQIYAYLFTLAFSVFAYTLMSGFVPISFLWKLQVLNVPLIISSKLLQVFVNYKNGHTGNLSAITVSLVFLGSSARIFTSIKETGDSIIILSFILASFINLLLVLQIVYYWEKTNLFAQKNMSKKKM